MRLSKRVTELAESATLAVSAKAAALQAQGIDVVSFGAGEPDFDTPDHVKEAAWNALRAGETKYAKPASGVAPLKKAIAAKLKRENGLDYDPQTQVIVTVGGKEALFLAFATILDPGDEVILPAPYWVSYPEQIKLNGGVPVIIWGEAGNAYKITPKQLAVALSPRTRAFVFNSPSNPGGFVYEPAEVSALAEVLEGRGVIVLSDEIYDRLVFGGGKYKSYATASTHAYEHTITFNAGSKTYSMTGWRIGYAAGPREIIKSMASLQSQTTSGPATFIQHGLAAALAGDQACVEVMRAAFEERALHMHRRLNAIADVECPKPSGAFYVFPDVSGCYERLGVKGSVEFSGKLLEGARVAVVPGEAFGMDDCVRLSCATSMEKINKGMERIEAFLG